MKHAILVACLVGGPALVAGAARLLQPSAPVEKRYPAPVRVLIDRSLQETPVRLLKIERGTVSFTPLTEPADAPARSRSLSDLLAVAPGPASAPIARPVSREAAPLVAVSTSDGQRLVGHLRAPGEGDKTKGGAGVPLVLESAVLGRIVLALDLVSGVDLIENPDDSRAPAGTDDAVVLANGDRIDGFIESVGPTVVIKAKGAESDTAVPLERVRLILLSNPSKALSGMMVWLSDGSVVALDGMPESDGQVFKSKLRLGGTAFAAPLSAVSAIALSAGQIMPLGSLKPADFKPAPERRWTRPPRAIDSDTTPLGAADIEIPGPMSVEWVLPAGVSRLAGTAELARSTQGWGDCEVVIEDLAQGAPARRLFSKHLSVQGPSVRFDVALAPALSAEHRLRVTVDSGQRGPIQDRVFLRRPLLLVGDRAPAN